MGINLSSGGLRKVRGEAEDVNPMAGIVNLVDCMLVFSCGLMIALVAQWNINLGPSSAEVLMENQVTEVSDINEITADIQSGGSSYNELGMVYQDPTTGKMYMLSESTDTAATADTAAIDNTTATTNDTATAID